MEEIWKDVKGFEGRFKASSLGNIISINGKFKGEKLLNPAPDLNGYKITSLRNGNGIKRHDRVHVFIAETFLEKPITDKKLCVNHKDGDKSNNRVDNLEWVTHRENIAHAVRTGLFNTKGEKHFNAKLTSVIVLKIKSLLATMKDTDIGNLFGVHRKTINDIRLGKTWGHL